MTKILDVDVVPGQARQVVDYFLEDFLRFGYSTDSYLGRECCCVRVTECVGVCACVRVCACVCMYVCVRESIGVCMSICM